MSVHLYEVGGHVRDMQLGIRSNDIDFAVEADSFMELFNWLNREKFDIFLIKEEFQTIRARFPKGHANAGLTADFVLCRKDGNYSDGRRPDSVTPGTIFDDLARRDFTVNAMARDIETGELIDPHKGERDLRNRILRTVGNPFDRLAEDSLRALRAIRFDVTKGLRMTADLEDAVFSPGVADLLENVSRERIREELNKCFKHDTLDTLTFISATKARHMRKAIFRDGLRLDATLAV